MTEEELTELGAAYKRACRHKQLVHERASQIAGMRLDCLLLARAQAEELDNMDNLSLGVLLLCDWGATVPPELMSKANVMPNIQLDPLEIH